MFMVQKNITYMKTSHNQWERFGVFIVDFEHNSNLVLV